MKKTVDSTCDSAISAKSEEARCSNGPGNDPTLVGGSTRVLHGAVGKYESVKAVRVSIFGGNGWGEHGHHECRRDNGGEPTPVPRGWPMHDNFTSFYQRMTLTLSRTQSEGDR